MRIVMIFALVIQAAFAQQRGGVGGAAGRGFAGHGRTGPGVYRGFGAPVRNSFVNPYLLGGYGFWGDYSDWDGYPYSEAYVEPQPTRPNVIIMAPPRTVAPVQPAAPVVHEYTAAPEGAESALGAATFTIVLKNGSQLSAIATWVQDGKLHYLDSQGKHQVLSAEVIDRRATERSNEEKHLRMQLPPD